MRESKLIPCQGQSSPDNPRRPHLYPYNLHIQHVDDGHDNDYSDVDQCDNDVIGDLDNHDSTLPQDLTSPSREAGLVTLPVKS